MAKVHNKYFIIEGYVTTSYKTYGRLTFTKEYNHIRNKLLDFSSKHNIMLANTLHINIFICTRFYLVQTWFIDILLFSPYLVQ